MASRWAFLALIALSRHLLWQKASAASDKVPFFDYDCALVSTQANAVGDWEAVHAWIRHDVLAPSPNKSMYALPEESHHLLISPVTERAEKECPIGMLFLAVLHFYLKVDEGLPHHAVAPLVNRVHVLMQRFEAYELALSRWPIFAALEHYAPSHHQHYDLYCDGTFGVVDWPELRKLANDWAHMQRSQRIANHFGISRPSLVLDENEQRIAEMVFTVLRHTKNQDLAQEECPWGFYFLCALQVVDASNRETQHLPAFHLIINHFLKSHPFPQIAGSGWPIFTVLNIFADLNKGIWFFKGDKKYHRGYSDWDLRSDELSPLVPSANRFLSAPWQQRVIGIQRDLSLATVQDFSREVKARLSQREAEDGPLRPLVAKLLDAAHQIVRLGPPDGPRLAYVVLLYGGSWALLLTRMAQRLQQLEVPHPLFVIAIGEDASRACKALSRKGLERQRYKVVCWSPLSVSQVHRFIAMHALLHLGIDLIYLDMDTFFFRDPTERILALAEGKDALFASHADADCVNIGVFYLRASPASAVWFSQFLAWYYDYPFEIDQRGLHMFLGLPSKFSVANFPEDRFPIRGARMDDVNEIVIWDVGWHGEASSILIGHWCHRPLDLKETEINQAYDAGDIAHQHGIPLHVLLDTTKGVEPIFTPLGTPLEKVLILKALLEKYRKDAPPIRTHCW